LYKIKRASTEWGENTPRDRPQVISFSTILRTVTIGGGGDLGKSNFSTISSLNINKSAF